MFGKRCCQTVLLKMRDCASLFAQTYRSLRTIKRMKPRRSLLAVSILCLTLAIPILAANERLQLGAVLTGFRQVPSVSTKGRGEFRAKVNDDGTQIKFTLKYADLEGAPTAAHIHFGQHFSNGGIMAILCG